MEKSYQQQLDKTIFDRFVNIPENLVDYEVRKIVYNNTLSYLKNALLRTPEDKHHLIFAGYSADMEKIINFCQRNIEKTTFELSEEFIQGLHKTLYPEGYVQKSKDTDGKEFVWMIPGEYRKIDINSNDNTNKNIYLKPQEIREGMKKIIGEYNKKEDDIQGKILYLLADFFIVHPFGDGNGRVAYILTDLLLLKNNLKPLYFGQRKENDKVGFYKILDKVYETRNLTPFYDFLEKYSV